MFCPQCGSEQNEGVRFCNKCGFRFPEQPASQNNQATQSTGYAPQQPQGFNPAPVNPYYNPQQPVYNGQPAGGVNYNQPPAYMTQPVKKSGAGKIVASVIMAVFFFAFYISSVFFGAFVTNFNGDSVAALAKYINFESITITDHGRQKTLGGIIYENLPSEMRGEYGISYNDFDRIINDDGFKTDASKLLGNYIEHLCGNPEKKVTAKDYVNLFESHSDMIYEKSGYTVTDSDLDDIYDMFSGRFSYLTTDGFDRETGLPAGSFDLRAIFTIALVVMIVLCLIFAGIIALINRKCISHTLLYFGIPFVVSGFNLLTSSFALTAVSGFGLLQPMFTACLIFGAVSLLAGAGMIVAFTIYTTKKNKC